MLGPLSSCHAPQTALDSAIESPSINEIKERVLAEIKTPKCWAAAAVLTQKAMCEAGREIGKGQ